MSLPNPFFLPGECATLIRHLRQETATENNEIRRFGGESQIVMIFLSFGGGGERLASQDAT
jgi:hypothetical protein